MNKYEEEMFDFLSIRDRYSYAWKLYELFPKVNEKLRRDFFQIVKEKLAMNSYNVTQENDNYAHRFLLRKDEWRDFTIYLESRNGWHSCSEPPYYGVTLFDRENYPADKVIDCLENSSQDIFKYRPGKCWPNFFQNQSTRWLYWNYLDLKFGELRYMEQILTENREQKATEIAGIVIDFAVTCDEIGRKIAGMKKMSVPD